jgi:hypothetical protein
MASSSWVQPYNDPVNRVVITHTGNPRRQFAVDGAFTSFEGRTYPVGSRGEHVTDEITIDTVWGGRADAEVFLAMLRSAAQGVDGRLELHIGAMEGGVAVEMVAECHAIPEDLAAGKTTVAVTFRRVDGAFTVT